MPNAEINDLTNKVTPLSTDEVEIQATAGGASNKATLANVSKAITITKSQVSDFSDGDYATAAQGATADTASQPGHTHPTTDLTATGGTSTSYLRKDNTWATPTNTTYTEISEAEITAGTASTSRTITGRRAGFIKARANHTGTQPASTISDFDTEVSNNTDVAANTTHRGTTTGNPHNVTKSDVGLGNVDNTSDATKNSATATLTNKTIDGDNNTLQDIGLESMKATVACRAYRAAAQNAGAATDTKVLFDAENFDTGSDFDVANSRFVAPVTGYYQVNATVGLTDILDTAENRVSIFVNGSAYSIARGYSSNTNADPAMNIADLVPVTAGQYIEIYVFQNGGVEPITPGTTNTYVSIYLVGV